MVGDKPMSYTQMTVFGICFVFLMTSLGATLVYFFKEEVSPKTQAVFLGFSSGIMLAASVFSLLLPAIEQTEKGWGRYAFIPAFIGFLSGGAFMLLFGFFFDKFFGRQIRDARTEKGFKLFLAVTLHNIPEGLAVGFSFGAAYALQERSGYLSALLLSVGVAVQNFPEGAAVALPLKNVFKSKTKAFLYGAGSGIVEPVFALLGFFCAARLQALQPWLLSFSAGTMIFVVAEDMLPDLKGKELLFGVCAFMLGFALMMALDVALG